MKDPNKALDQIAKTIGQDGVEAVTASVTLEQLVMCRSDGMKGAVENQIEYWNTYTKQHGYEDYSTETFLEDSLYGIGVSIDPEKYKFADGYKRFKDDLKAWLSA